VKLKGLAVSMMGINLVLAGVPDTLGITGPFLVLTSLKLIAAVVLLKNIETRNPLQNAKVY
jgi:hypothetical protein